MPFPFSITGVIEIAVTNSSPITVEEVAERIVWLLEARKAHSVHRMGSRIQFKGAFDLLGLKPNILGLIGRSELRIEKRGTSIFIEYDLNTVPLLVIVTTTFLLLPFVGILLFASTRPGHFLQNIINIYGSESFIELMVIGLLWVFGGNYVITRFLFRERLVMGLSAAFSSARVQAVRR
jgi:hypothetical protein